MTGAHLRDEAPSGVADAASAAATASVLQGRKLASERSQAQHALIAEVVGHSQRLQPGQALHKAASVQPCFSRQAQYFASLAGAGVVKAGLVWPARQLKVTAGIQGALHTAWGGLHSAWAGRTTEMLGGGELSSPEAPGSSRPRS